MLCQITQIPLKRIANFQAKYLWSLGKSRDLFFMNLTLIATKNILKPPTTIKISCVNFELKYRGTFETSAYSWLRKRSHQAFLTELIFPTVTLSWKHNKGKESICKKRNILKMVWISSSHFWMEWPDNSGKGGSWEKANFLPALSFVPSYFFALPELEKNRRDTRKVTIFHFPISPLLDFFSISSLEISLYRFGC